MTLYWHPTGLRVGYERGVLTIHDINPEINTQCSMSRGEMLLLGLRCIWAACRGRRWGR